MIERSYMVELQREDDGRWIADLATIPGCLAYGNTREQALDNVRKLALEVLAEMKAHGEPFPEDLDVERITLQVA